MPPIPNSDMSYPRAWFSDALSALESDVDGEAQPAMKSMTVPAVIILPSFAAIMPIRLYQ
jgi:hypothetical protein